MDEVLIRVAHIEDAEALRAIYAPYVTDTVISFEYEVPGALEFRGRMEKTLARYPYLVAERNGEALGYAYTSPYRTRPAYGWCAETTVYVRKDARGMGVGKRLYRALEDASRAQGVAALYACVGCPEVCDEHLTDASLRFHERMGYKLVGAFPRCGYKFGRWYGVAWLERALSARDGAPMPLIPFPELSPETLAALGIEA